jgi:hypothetical protein
MSAPKRAVVAKALAELALVWPRDFCTAEATRKGHLFDRTFAGIHDDCVVDTALEWIDHSEFPPKPAQLRGIAERLQRSRHPHEEVPVVLDEAAMVEAVRVQKLQERKDKRGQHVLDQVGERVGEACAIFTLLYAMCKTAEDVERIRAGRATREELDAAIAAHRAGQTVILPVLEQATQQ